jgi:hypothetical protein
MCCIVLSVATVCTEHPLSFPFPKSNAGYIEAVHDVKHQALKVLPVRTNFMWHYLHVLER